MKKIILILFIFFLTGCETQNEIENYSIVAGFGIDAHKEGFELSLEIIDYSAGGEHEYKGKVISISGATIDACFGYILDIYPFMPYMSHCGLILIGDELARDSIVEVLDYILTHSEIRYTVSVMVAKDKKAKEILEYEQDKYKVVSFGLLDNLKNNRDHSNVVSITKYYLNMDSFLDGHSSGVLPIVSIIEDTFDISGAALFDGYQLIDYIEYNELNYIKIIRGHFKVGTLKITEEDSPTFTNISSKWKFTEDTISIHVKIDAKLMIDNINNISGEDTAKVIKEKEIEFAEILDMKLKENIESYQEKEIDIYTFGDYIYKHNPFLYRKINGEFKSYYRNAKVKVKTSFSIESTKSLAT